MKSRFALLSILLAIPFVLCAQNWDYIRSSGEYYYGVGYGATVAEAAWNYKANEYDKLQWYLPSVSELEMIYKNKKAINEFLSKYIDGAIEIGNDWYWSSTEYNDYSSWYVPMTNGDSNYNYSRYFGFRVRAVAVVK